MNCTDQFKAIGELTEACTRRIEAALDEKVIKRLDMLIEMGQAVTSRLDALEKRVEKIEIAG